MGITSTGIAIDFETYYDAECSVRPLGPDGYCRHPKFDPYLVSIYGDGFDYVGPTECAPWDEIPADAHFVAHNAGFDSVVFQAAQRSGMIPEGIKPSWSCSANLSVYIQAPRSLKGVAEQMLGVKPDKAVRDGMKGKLPKDLSQDELKSLIDYGRMDSVYCKQVWDKYNEFWPAQEQQLARHTMTSGQRGVYIDQNLLELGLAILATKKKQNARVVPWAADDEPVNSLKQLQAFCGKEGIPAPASTNQNDPACAAWEAEYGEKYPVVAALRDWRKANRLLRLFETVQTRLRPDGTLPFGLKYFGAALTGRWSGDTGLNMQNLPRGESFGVDTRSLFIPRPGKKFIICDLAQIEPRCLAWLCGDTELLEIVASGKDIYTAHAMATMGAKRVSKKMRQLAKIRVLGLGYGCGAKKFREIAAGWGIPMTSSEAESTVREYRRQNPKVCWFWKDCENGMKDERDPEHLIYLPSERPVRYFNIQREKGQLTASTTRGQNPYYWYGGKICENLVQATARDVFADCYARVLNAGFEVVWSVHDELIVEVDENDKDAAKEIENLMSITPDWLEGCPIGAVAYEATKYTK